MLNVAEELKELLQNITGKEISSSPRNVAQVMHDYNAKYICVVTFSKTPSDAVITLKKGTEEIEPASDGTYHLKEGTYTYDAEAEGYVSKTGESLVITNEDETTGTKTVTVTLVEED